MKEMLRMVDKSKVDEVKQMLEYTQKGTAKATVGNYMVVLRNDPLVRESMKYNKLTGRIDIVKKLWWNEEVCKLDDDGRTYFYYFFECYYKLTSEKCMDKALRIEANSRAYHPICEYLEQLEWDGQERIRYVLQRYMGADASDFVYEVVKHFLMEALSRIYRPGCKADEMLCLVGQQGAGKSTFFRFLALNDDWFSDDLKQSLAEAEELLDDLQSKNQKMFLLNLVVMVTGNSFDELDASTEKIEAVFRKHVCTSSRADFQQEDCLASCLPLGNCRLNVRRTLTTESLAVFMPFKVQEVQDKGGIYFGENAISHNLIMCNKANLLNQSAFLLGVPGSGKSFSAKELIAFLILNTEDDVLICDPENEFGALAAALGEETATVIHMAAGGKDRLNAMYMVDGYGENNPIVEKSQFIMSLVEQIDKTGVGPQQKSIIDRCTALVYQEAEANGTTATLCNLRNKLLEQPEEKAKEIALSLELFTTGSLDIFGHESTVDLDNRIVVFDIHSLGAQLKPTGLLVITDTILNRVTLNWKKGKRTHIFIDEFHVVFENEQSGIFFNSAWRQFRKRNGYPTAITQNVEYLLDSVQASTMLSNSEFVVMLNQAYSDRAKLSKLLNISDEQMSYVTNADAGCGLIKYGSALVPFINRFPRDTKLYQLMTTKPGEGVFGGNTSN